MSKTKVPEMIPGMPYRLSLNLPRDIAGSLAVFTGWAPPWPGTNLRVASMAILNDDGSLGTTWMLHEWSILAG